MGVNKLSKNELGRNSYQHLVNAANTAADTRANTELHCVDIDYESLIEDPIKYIKLIYNELDLDYSDDDFAKHQKFLDENSQHKFGKHEYSLEEWGLDEESIENAFDGYLRMQRNYL